MPGPPPEHLKGDPEGGVFEDHEEVRSLFHFFVVFSAPDSRIIILPVLDTLQIFATRLQFKIQFTKKNFKRCLALTCIKSK